MAITITGGKYASVGLASVNTTTIVVASATFTSTDFAVPRRCDLYNAAGTTFKGMAFVRAYVSTTSLQLETVFFDPKTGATVSQVIGDTVLISKNWADVAQTGIAVSTDNTVNISDTLVLGTSGVVNSLCFHDENKSVYNTVTAVGARNYDVAGGFITFGHLQSYADKSWYGGCNFTFINTALANSFAALSTAARMCFWGGSHIGNGGNSLYATAGGYSNGGYTPYGTDWAYLWWLEVKVGNTDILSKATGENWTTGTNHVLENCSFTGSGASQIFLRFGNGSVLGGQFKVLNNSTAPISIFGADASAGTYYIGAPAGKRSIVSDMGGNNVLWRASTNWTQNIIITNLISTDYRLGYGSTPESYSMWASTKYIYFKDNYTNLKDATAVGMINDAAWTLDDSAVASGDGSTVAVQVFQSTATGHTVGTSRDPWTYRVRKYGYDELEGAVALVAYPLGTAGTAYNVSFGGYTNQIATPALSGVSNATALAISGITVTDHEASPVSWNGKNWSITITASTDRTVAEIFAHIKAGIAINTAWNGKTGLLWHVLVENSGTSYFTQRGKSGGAGASLKGVRVITPAGDEFPGFTSMTADDGSTYTPAVSTSFTLTGLVTGTEVHIYNTSDSTQLAVSEGVSGTSFAYSYNWTGDVGVFVTILKEGYQWIRMDGLTLTASAQSIPVAQSIDRTFNNPA